MVKKRREEAYGYPARIPEGSYQEVVFLRGLLDLTEPVAANIRLKLMHRRSQRVTSSFYTIISVRVLGGHYGERSQGARMSSRKANHKAMHYSEAVIS